MPRKTKPALNTPLIIMPPTTSSIVTKIKVQLKLAVARLRLVQKQDETLSKTQRRDMAKLLEAGKIDSARIRVENIIRSDITTELHEILELYCELLLARAGLLDGPTCDPGLEEAIKSIIYAAPKTEIKELLTVRTLLAEKYGKPFVLEAMENSDGKVNKKVVKKLSVAPPKEELVQGYLEEIAKAYGVNWPKRDVGEAPPHFLDDDNDNPSGSQAQKNVETPLAADSNNDSKDAAAQEELSKATPPKHRLDLAPSKTMQAASASKPALKKDDNGSSDLEALSARFAALSKK